MRAAGNQRPPLFAGRSHETTLRDDRKLCGTLRNGAEPGSLVRRSGPIMWPITAVIIDRSILGDVPHPDRRSRKIKQETMSIFFTRLCNKGKMFSVFISSKNIMVKA
ncbi:hypothetical protein GWI33_000056 [Rhynchophorus ferrugineus]|uniref:Uncharacterized protein n=1 Tax=Rhynchophorus ferrugineus TaxID=354439 RepID=A0A834MLY6_RHYFE|nr:hypothetical protein GWI33_000056 [Rhynchophorus ferrugineus]